MRRARAWLLRATVVCTLAGTVLTSAAATCAWPDWDAFRRSTISQDGRVIDDSTDQQVTVSEGSRMRFSSRSWPTTAPPSTSC